MIRYEFAATGARTELGAARRRREEPRTDDLPAAPSLRLAASNEDPTPEEPIGRRFLRRDPRRALNAGLR